MKRIILILLFIFSSQSFADTNSEKCEHEAKLLKLIEMVQQDLPEAKLIINQNCKIEIINLKELKEKESHQIKLFDEHNRIV